MLQTNVPSVAIKSYCSHHLAEDAGVLHVSLATTGSTLSFLAGGLTLCPQVQSSLIRSFSKTGTLRVLEFSVLMLYLPTSLFPRLRTICTLHENGIVSPSHNT